MNENEIGMIFVNLCANRAIYSIYGGLCRTYDHPIDLPTSSHVSMAAADSGEPGLR